MWTLLKRLWLDPAAFLSACNALMVWSRAPLLAFGAAVQAGQINLGHWGYWVAPLMMGSAVLIQAKQPPVHVQIARMAPEERAQLATTLMAPGPVKQP